MKKRVIALLTALVIAIGSISALAIVTGAEAPAPELSIPYCNLSFKDSIGIKYAVRSDFADTKLLIWTSPKAEYTAGTQDAEITSYYTEEIDGAAHKIFDYYELCAKQMTDVVYARAYSQVDGVDYYSEVNKYSILQYAYNKLGKTATASADTELKEMLVDMLEYGASAQKYLDDYKVDRLATADWYQVKLAAGVLDDGCTHGLYLPGDKVTLTAPSVNAEGATFTYWANSKNNKIATVTSTGNSTAKVVGKGTEAMAAMKSGTLDILTGLGNGYDTSVSGNKPLLLGGGVGVPPMYGLCKKLIAEGKTVRVVLGFNTKDEIFYEEEFKALGARTVVTTVDGSYGQKGFVTDAMGEDYTYFYTCGPEPMLKAVFRSTKTEGQLSFEERMGCGFGACMGCSCKTIYGNKRICKEGPVLRKEEILWEK